ncbi:hypothetical protein [Bordetella bronchialis]|uniref:hypothetical protein n=1 Tax=Bordetella bronchialis TaxID=463025 RepID=UPI000A4CBFE7|nr:hypothetical protein [Bordetella bronchialis]
MVFWLCVTTGGRVVLSEKPHGPVIDIITVVSDPKEAWRAARAAVRESQFVHIAGHGFFVRYERSACWM